MLPPSAIAGVSLVCALGPWVFTQPMVLRVLAAAAAATAVAGAVVMRHWDTQAGKRVADLTRARASDEWRFEERVAELESDLDESRELRTKLEQRLRAKRAELAGLRNEHAALLRRYAAAEVDRASALEERRVLEIEAAVPARALPAGTSAAPGAVPAQTVRGDAAERKTARERTGAAEAKGNAAAGGAEPTAPGVFSPEGSELYTRADAALARLAGRAGTTADESAADASDGSAPDAVDAVDAVEAVDADGPVEKAAAGPAARTGADGRAATAAPVAAEGSPARDGLPKSDGLPKGDTPREGDGTPEDDGPEPTKRARPEPAQEGDAEGQSGAAGDHERTAASSAADAPAAQPARQPSGHFTVPTAVAVVPPTAPVRRQVSEGGFDFFGTKKDTGRSELDTVQNEDLADVVGQEALALHKAEAEARFKPADEDARGIGQVIDLTAHDETEHIDVQGLRSAVS
ncbi:hypothetical protein GCM10017779_14790 [Streptomyces capillispiralis]|uniref:Secreted protein n=2 Tax=Streptomyces capillispiralis TaxID=68182 RepID=A0A561TG73_9ACTN|nr:hypothetical protein FHX78_113065 [Streptomyces capillispiralis]GHH91022.1 hypothetical protein GCM10017779_14790 [Streptomyces capillispiralis]